jgi:hypothetical protein
MPGKTPAPHELPYPLQGDKPPHAEAAVKPLAERLHQLLDAIDPAQIEVPGGAGDKSKLLVVDNTGAAAFQTMKGDATLTPDGTLAIGEKKLLTAMLADLGVTTPKLANKSVTELKLAGDVVPRLHDERVPRDGSVSRPKLKGTIQTARSTFDFAGGPGYVAVAVNWPEAWGDTAYTVIPTVRSAHAVSVARLSSVSKTGVTVVLHREEAAPANGASAELHIVGIHD